MKKDKLLKKLVLQAVEVSFKDGKVIPSKVKAFSEDFRKLPTYKAIYCLTEYSKGIQRKLQESSLSIESTVNLSPIQIKQIEKEFKKDFAVSSVSISLNPSLLGGLRIKMGDKVFDDSLKRRISQIGEAINV